MTRLWTCAVSTLQTLSVQWSGENVLIGIAIVALGLRVYGWHGFMPERATSHFDADYAGSGFFDNLGPRASNQPVCRACVKDGELYAIV